MERHDPVADRTDGSDDLHDIATWEPRTALDRLAVSIYAALLTAARGIVILTALLILVALVATAGLSAVVVEPTIGVLTLLSAVPAFLLAAYVYVTDVTTSEPLDLLVATFILGVLFAGFAGLVNSYLGPALRSIPGLGLILFFYLVVGPVEETVKWLAVRLHAFRSREFNAVIDGAIYGAVAGLGFATIENALYITRGIDPSGTSNALVLAVVGVLGLGGVENILGAGGEITAFRALSGPGHVIYSAFAGYYLGLAKFNPDRAGPIVVKGLLIAAFIHATYNTLVGIVPALVEVVVPGVSQLVVVFAFVVVYDGIFFYALFRKLSGYRDAYRAVHATDEREERDPDIGRTEFDP